MVRLHAHLLQTPAAPHEARLRSRLAAGVTVTCGPDPDPACQVLVSGRPEPAHARACPRLQALVVPWAGMPPETRALAAAGGYAVHNLHHNAASTAEMALTLLLAAAHRIVPIDRALRRGDWRPRYTDANPSVPLFGKTALVLGYGSIGRRVAAACRGLGMRVCATKRGPLVPDDCPDALHPPEALHALLPAAQALIVCLPLTDDTRGLVGARELALLPPRAVLVNVARGDVVCEDALYEALSAGRLHAAGVDVWYRYPADEAERACTRPSRHPFHELDNVVLSPHRAGAFNTEETEAARMDALAELLNALARGESPNRVDLARGY